MSIVSEINRINTNIANAYSKCDEKGATMPQVQDSSNLANTIDSISGGVDITEYFTNVDVLKYPQSYIKKFPYPIDLINQTDCGSLFSNTYKNLQEIKIINADNVTGVNSMFNSCTSLKLLDIRSLILTNCTHTGSTRIFGTGVSRVPYTCEIIVKDEVEKQWMATNYVNYTNVKTVDEYENS